MTCRDVSESLLDYRCGGLDRAARVGIGAHLSRCARCVAYARNYDAVVRLTASAFTAQPEPIAMPGTLAKKILAARQAAQPVRAPAPL